jgi:glutathione S-transferase
MNLHFAPGACSLSPHIVLREAGLDFELTRVDLVTHTLPDGADYHEVNPRGYVPVLKLDDGELLSEGPAIVQYIADLVPTKGLAPAAGTMARYRLQEWLAFINAELHKLMVPLFDPSTHVSTRESIVAKLRSRLDWVSQQLGDKAFALGECFTVADAYLFTMFGWLGVAGLNVAAWPTLAAHSARVAARPAVRAALQAEGLLR